MNKRLHTEEDNCEMIPLFNEDGTIKPKDEFMQDISEFYDAVANSNDESIMDTLAEAGDSMVPQNVINNYDFLSRTIYIVTQITDIVSKEIIRKIRFWNITDDMDNIPVEKREPIKLYIDTPGGSLIATLSIIDAIQLSKTPVHTITYGIGYSGGFFIGLSGHKRYGFPHSAYLFHEGSLGEDGDSHKVLQRIEFHKVQLKQLKQIVLSKTNITEENYENHRKDDWIFNAEEALHYGIIDEIIKSFDGGIKDE